MVNDYDEKSELDRDLRLVTLGVGAYNGFCDARGLPKEDQMVEYALLFGPTVANGVVGAVKGAGKGFIAGTAGGTVLGIVRTSMRRTLNLNEPEEGGGLERTVRDTSSGLVLGAATGTMVGASVGGSLGIIHGGVISLMGYWIGYGVGQVMNYI
jgi:hypothetical protein